MADNTKPAQGGKGGGQITIDSAFITDVRNRVAAIRGQITSVRGGVNPQDVAHPHGMSLATIKLQAGAGSFQAGADVNKRVGGVGQQVDQKLGDLDQKLVTYGQDLDHLLSSADNVEVNNMSLSDLDRYVGNMGDAGQSILGGGTTPPTVGSPTSDGGGSGTSTSTSGATASA